MKVTLNIPEAVLRQAKKKARELGIPLARFIVEAIEEKLRVAEPVNPLQVDKALGQRKQLRPRKNRR